MYMNKLTNASAHRKYNLFVTLSLVRTLKKKSLCRYCLLVINNNQNQKCHTEKYRLVYDRNELLHDRVYFDWIKRAACRARLNSIFSIKNINIFLRIKF